MNQTIEFPHRRLNALTGEWVLVSPHRARRPWQGKVDKPSHAEKRVYDPDCFLCPGNRRAGGESNPDYPNTFVFTNDFAALLPEQRGIPEKDPLLSSMAVQGTCRVICFSPRHDLTLAEMNQTDIESVIGVWQEQIVELGAQYRWVQVFENKGEIMGCSNPHPHGQIWASQSIPNEPFKENQRQESHFIENDSVLLLDYLERERVEGSRIVYENPDWIVLVPFWACWPFETLVASKRHMTRLTDANETERRSLAAALKTLLVRYDNLFNSSFPYTMGWHGAPMDASNPIHWHAHAHFFPPLLRSAEVKKFMVGYEMLAEPQRDITPEQASEKLRAASDVHYKTTGSH